MLSYTSTISGEQMTLYAHTQLVLPTNVDDLDEVIWIRGPLGLGLKMKRTLEGFQGTGHLKWFPLILTIWHKESYWQVGAVAEVDTAVVIQWTILIGRIILQTPFLSPKTAVFSRLSHSHYLKILFKSITNTPYQAQMEWAPLCWQVRWMWS